VFKRSTRLAAPYPIRRPWVRMGLGGVEHHVRGHSGDVAQREPPHVDEAE